jgi:hypothetical protein
VNARLILSALKSLGICACVVKNTFTRDMVVEFSPTVQKIFIILLFNTILFFLDLQNPLARRMLISQPQKSSTVMAEFKLGVDPQRQTVTSFLRTCSSADKARLFQQCPQENITFGNMDNGDIPESLQLFGRHESSKIAMVEEIAAHSNGTFTHTRKVKNTSYIMAAEEMQSSSQLNIADSSYAQLVGVHTSPKMPLEAACPADVGLGSDLVHFEAVFFKYRNMELPRSISLWLEMYVAHLELDPPGFVLGLHEKSHFARHLCYDWSRLVVVHLESGDSMVSVSASLLPQCSVLWRRYMGAEICFGASELVQQVVDGNTRPDGTMTHATVRAVRREKFDTVDHRESMLFSLMQLGSII